MVYHFHCPISLIMLSDHRNYIFDDKYTNRDAGKYIRLQKPSHGGPPDGEYFGGLQHHFSRRMHRMLGDEEQSEHVAPFQPSDGAHIQLCRR